MKLRLASISFLLGALSTGVTWLTLQPALVRLMAATNGGTHGAALSGLRHLLPALMGLDLLVTSTVAFLVLYFALVRPLGRLEAAIDQLGNVQLDSGLPLERAASPLLSRVEGSLHHMGQALRRERDTVREQLAQLSAANQSLSRAQTELATAERLALVGKLAAGVAHEVGNPLSGILGYLSIAQARAKEPELSEFLQHIEEEVHRIDQIVRALLDMGRASSGKALPLELPRLVDSAVRLLSRGPEFALVQVAQQVPAGTVVRAEAGPLSQILLNLLINAAQAMGGRGTIHLAVRTEGSQVLISVEDEGPGIPPELLPRIFEPFFTTKEVGKGTGLGLAISLHLATSMGGSLTAVSPPGRGARFELRLPGIVSAN